MNLWSKLVGLMWQGECYHCHRQFEIAFNTMTKLLGWRVRFCPFCGVSLDMPLEAAELELNYRKPGMEKS